MSKPTARIVLVSLIAVVLVAAAYLTVQGAFAKAESAGAQAHVVSGLQTNFNHDRSTPAELEAQEFDQVAAGRGGVERVHGGPFVLRVYGKVNEVL